MQKVIAFIKKEAVLTVAALAAVISMLFTHPNSGYIKYIDFRVLSLLFCLMAVVAGFTGIGLFEVLSQRFVKKAASVKILSLILILLCFFTSMLITNDVALITFVPLTISILNVEHKSMTFVIVMQTIAANLGSMLTPVGNPQNLYLYSYYNINTAEFFKLMLPLGLISLILITAVTLFMKNRDLTVKYNKTAVLTDKRKALLYTGLFIICILTVFHFINYIACLIAVAIALLITDKSIFKRVDYSLLLTFVCFFVFVGNLSAVGFIKQAVSSVISGREMIVSALLSQIISNVPAAVMLSSFTDNYKALLYGTNIGGLGTLVASLASLISFKLYSKSAGADKGRYLLVFTILNVSFFIVIYVFSKIVI